MASSVSLAEERLSEERKSVRKDRPHGFFARPLKRANGTTDLFTWDAGVPGKVGTPWEGGVYRIRMLFPEDFPAKPPKCQFSPPLFHPNVYPSGTVCLSILDESKTWEPSLGVLEILQGIQQLLSEPNIADPAQREAYELLKTDRSAYEAKVREIAKANAP